MISTHADTTARMNLAQLRKRFGAQVPAFGPPPLAIEVRGPTGELWLLCDPPRGEDSTYKLEREWAQGVV